ncbi:MAG: PQQ-binding-like beta-propeller repeat protein [Bdellovibrionales bacterium]
MKISILVLSLISLLGCSNLAEKDSLALEVKGDWVRRVDLNKDLSTRKLHRMAPVFYKNLVLIGSNSYLSAFDSKSGRLKWKFLIPGGIEASGVVSEDGSLYFGSKNGLVYKLNIPDRAIQWSYNAKSEVLGKPLVHQGRLYVLASNNRLLALDTDDGKLVWSYKRRQNTRFTIRGSAQPTIDGMKIYASFSDGYTVALELKKAGLLWERKLNSGLRFSDIDTKPIIDGNQLFVGGYDGRVYALGKRDGQIQWQSKAGAYQSFTVSDKSLFVATTDSRVLEFDKTSGKILWNRKLSGRSLASEILVNKNLLLFAESTGGVKVFDKNSKSLLGQYTANSASFSPIRFKAETEQYYFVSNSGNLHSFKTSYQRSRKSWDWEE